MIKVAINGYGTIGKRVADAVAAQKDMKVIGVSKTRPNAEAFVAKQRGYPLYIADISKKPAFEKAGLKVAGSVEDMCKAADVVVDATPGKVGATNKSLYEKLGVKALWQGGEEHELAGFSFNSSCNYKDAIGRQFVRVVSCNTTGLCRIIHEIDKEFGVTHVHAIMVRRGSDPGEIKKGPIDAIVLDPVSVPSHHGPDVLSVLPHISITTMAMIVPTTMMHMHAIQMTTKNPVTSGAGPRAHQCPSPPRANQKDGRHQEHRRAQGIRHGPRPAALRSLGELHLRGIYLRKQERALLLPGHSPGSRCRCREYRCYPRHDGWGKRCGQISCCNERSPQFQNHSE